MVYFSIGNALDRSLQYVGVSAVLKRKFCPTGLFIDLKILQHAKEITSQTDVQCLLVCTLQFLDIFPQCGTTIRNAYNLVRLAISLWGDFVRL